MKKKILQLFAFFIILLFLSYSVSAGCACNLPKDPPPEPEFEEQNIDLKKEMLKPKTYFLGFYIWGHYIKSFMKQER